MVRRYFEDITDGEPLHCQKLIITRDDIIEFAKKFDPQPFHTDENAAKESIYSCVPKLAVISNNSRPISWFSGQLIVAADHGVIHFERSYADSNRRKERLGGCT